MICISCYSNVTNEACVKYGRSRAGFSECGTPERTCLTLPLPGIRSQLSSGRDGETNSDLLRAGLGVKSRLVPCVYRPAGCLPSESDS